jgi:hypothetical protein
MSSNGWTLWPSIAHGMRYHVQISTLVQIDVWVFIGVWNYRFLKSCVWTLPAIIAGCQTNDVGVWIWLVRQEVSIYNQCGAILKH